jgi:hypothetical protein
MSTKQDIDRGLEIVAQMDALKKELKAIAERVDKAALKGPQIPLEDPARDGTQYLAHGSAKIVPVVITADFLAQTFTSGSKKHEAIAAAAAGKLAEFYAPTTTYERQFEDGKVFRAKAREILGAEKAEPFIRACVVRDKFDVPKNAVKIEWARARLIESEVSA